MRQRWRKTISWVKGGFEELLSFDQVVITGVGQLASAMTNSASSANGGKCEPIVRQARVYSAKPFCMWALFGKRVEVPDWCVCGVWNFLNVTVWKGMKKKNRPLQIGKKILRQRSSTPSTMSALAGAHFIVPYDVLNTKLRCFSRDWVTETRGERDEVWKRHGDGGEKRKTQKGAAG